MLLKISLNFRKTDLGSHLEALWPPSWHQGGPRWPKTPRATTRANINEKSDMDSRLELESINDLKENRCEFLFGIKTLTQKKLLQDHFFHLLQIHESMFWK